MLVHDLSNGGAQGSDFLPALLEIVEDFGCVRAQTFRPNLTGREQNMGVVVALVALFIWRVQSNLGGHVIAVHKHLPNPNRQVTALRVAHFVWQRHNHLPANPRVLSRLSGLGCVPQHAGISNPGRDTDRSQHVHRHHALLPGVVVYEPRGVVLDPNSGPIGSGGGDAVAFASADAFDRTVINGHDAFFPKTPTKPLLAPWGVGGGAPDRRFSPEGGKHNCAFNRPCRTFSKNPHPEARPIFI